MRQFLSILLALQFSAYSYGQVGNNGQSRDELEPQRISLLSELQALEARAEQLEKPLALAAAKAEVADAAWTLDRVWAKKLLQEAYELSLPSEEVRARYRQIPIDSPPVMLTATDRARLAVRRRVMSVASRDTAFAEQIVQVGAKQLGRLEEHRQYAELADSAAERGDLEDAARYIGQAFEANPTLFETWPAISALAAQDRAAADKVIIQYIERLRLVSLSTRTGSFLRVFYILNKLLYPSPSDPETGGRLIQPPGPAVIR